MIMTVRHTWRPHIAARFRDQSNLTQSCSYPDYGGYASPADGVRELMRRNARYNPERTARGLRFIEGDYIVEIDFGDAR